MTTEINTLFLGDSQDLFSLSAKFFRKYYAQLIVTSALAWSKNK
ncbi:hypothetical protein IGI37_003274 [Enterococcus sp. AZ194]